MVFFPIINIMQNQQIKEKIEQIWSSIRLSRTAQLEQHLSAVREKVAQIIGGNDIQKLRNSSLLKILVYELIITLDQKTSKPSSQKTIRKAQESKSKEKTTRSLTRLNQIKELVCAMSSGRSSQHELWVDIGSFKNLLHKVRSLQRDLLKEEEEKKRVEVLNDSDSEGAEIMIQQLEAIVKRKENRINQLYKELEENFNDKQELEEEIQGLQMKNCEIIEKLKEVQDSLVSANEKCKEWETKYSALSQQFDKYKHKEKDELLFGVASFMQNSQPIKRMDNPAQQTTLHDDPHPQPITNSTKVLYKYCLPSITINDKAPPDQKTIKKKPFKMIESECESEEEDLLISIKQSKQPKPQKTLENADHSLQRVLLMQALFIEKALEDILS